MVVGAGPTGVELAAELHDLWTEDVRDRKLFPGPVAQQLRIGVVNTGDVLLSTYDRTLAEYATRHFDRQARRLRVKNPNG